MSDRFELVSGGRSDFFPSVEDALVAGKKVLSRLRIVRVSDGVLMAWRGPWRDDGLKEALPDEVPEPGRP